MAIAGEPPGWKDDLLERGIEVVDGDSTADLGVAADPLAVERLARNSPVVIVDRPLYRRDLTSCNPIIFAILAASEMTWFDPETVSIILLGR